MKKRRALQSSVLIVSYAPYSDTFIFKRIIHIFSFSMHIVDAIAILMNFLRTMVASKWHSHAFVVSASASRQRKAIRLQQVYDLKSPSKVCKV